jgi:hypothetical protein
MGFFSFLKYTFIIFAAHLATSCGAPFENHWPTASNGKVIVNTELEGMRKEAPYYSLI